MTFIKGDAWDYGERRVLECGYCGHDSFTLSDSVSIFECVICDRCAVVTMFQYMDYIPDPLDSE